MTPYELRRLFLNAHPSSLFFSRNNMKFAGDTMRNFGVKDCGDRWLLYRKRPTLFGGLRGFYFDKQTFRMTPGPEA